MDRAFLLLWITPSLLGGCSLIFPGSDYRDGGVGGKAGAGGAGSIDGGHPVSGGGGAAPTGPIAGTIFVLGGDQAAPEGTPPIGEVYTNEVTAIDVLSDGSLGAWRYEEPMPFAPSTTDHGPTAPWLDPSKGSVRVFGWTPAFSRMSFWEGTVDAAGGHLTHWELSAVQADFASNCTDPSECESGICIDSLCRSCVQNAPAFAANDKFGFVVGGDPNNAQFPRYPNVWAIGDDLHVAVNSTSALQKPRWGTRAHVAGGRLFVLFGYEPNTYPSPEIEIVDIAADGSASSAQVTQTPHYQNAAVSLIAPAVCHNDRFIYAVGGRLNNGGPTDILVWADFTVPETQWQVASDPETLLPSGRDYAACIATSDHLYVFGGHNSRVLEDVQMTALDPQTGAPGPYREGPPMGHGRMNMTAFFVPRTP